MVIGTQDVVLLLIPPLYPYDISWKGGNSLLNRFCIDEEMAFETSGVYFKKKNSIGSASEGKANQNAVTTLWWSLLFNALVVVLIFFRKYV